MSGNGHNNDPALEFFQRQLNELGDRMSAVHKLANTAFNDISSHEKICAERYGNINKQLEVIPKIFGKLDGLYKMAYMFLGGFTLASVGFLGTMVAIIVYISKMQP